MLTGPLTGQPEIEKVLFPQVAMGRPGRPEEVARTVTFLASDDASYITGDEVFVEDDHLASQRGDRWRPGSILGWLEA